MEIKKLKLSYKELKQIKKGEVLYLKKDKSLISTPQINCDIILIISHYLQLGVNSNNNSFTQIWGLHPQKIWIKKKLNIPNIIKGIVYLNNIDVNEGDIIRIEETKYWDTLYDEESGWIKVGDSNIKGDIFVEIFTDILVGINHDNTLNSIWLKPKINN